MSKEPIERPIKRTGNLAGFIIFGLLLGLILGGVLGFTFGTPDSGLRKNPDPQAQMFANIFRPIELCFGFVAAVIGAAVGGTIGAVAGIFLGKRVATADAPPGAAAVLDAPETPEDEARRLRARIAFIQERLDDIERGERPSARENRMIRRDVVAADFMYTEIRVFERSDAASPLYQVGWDLDTEWVSYFESPTATRGTMVLAPFEAWTIDVLRSRVAKHAAEQPWSESPEAAELIDAVVDAIRARR